MSASTPVRLVVVHPDKEVLAQAVAARLLTRVLDVQSVRSPVHVVLTGGTVGIASLAAVAASPLVPAVDWSGVHVWWGDERFLPDGDPDRNETQARNALIDALGEALPVDNVHPMPARSDDVATPEASAEAYAAALAEAGSPAFDVLLLGMGPDGHIASLFPHRSGIQVTDRTVIPVRNSPKPPPERLSLTRPVLNASQRVWLVLAGADKASALGLALAGASRDEVPVAGIKGRRRTVFFVDADAAAEVPEGLIARDY
jgi:6-phosphogluconolactonase